MEKNQSHTTERILNLTLEIIYLLTGEDYGPIKKESTGPPPPTLIHKKNRKKVLAVNQKIVELLTGEVPIRCQDVTVYFSMEEWEYVEGHKELYKDVMMASQPALISPDGSSKRNPPERCPRPLYSRDSTQEHQEIPQEDQNGTQIHVKVEVKEEEEDPSVMGDEPCKEEKGPPEISTDGENRYNERAAISLRVEVEEGDITSDSSDYDPITPKGHLVLLSADLSFDPSTRGTTLSSQSSTITHNTVYSEGETLARYEGGGENVTQGENFVEEEISDAGQKENSFSCSECGKCFALRSSLTRHRRVHSGSKPYVCPKCGKRFLLRSYLTSHQKVHLGEKPYCCPECGKRFAVKSGFTRHQKVHSAERPLSCSQCGKCFQWKSSLDYHRKTHDVEKPFACHQCGKSFQWRTFLDFHMHTHSNEKPPSS